MRYFLHLGFDGTNYSGWQKQANTNNTVQDILERTLAKVCKNDVSVYGCGRTDAGVHASQYVAHIDLEQRPKFDLKYRLNKNLPQDIAIYDILEMDNERHSRFDASARTYDYFIHWKKDPNLIRYSAFYEDHSLDFDLMRSCTELISNTKDFRPLCKQPDLYDNTRCKVTACTLKVNEVQGRMRFTITSDRFLRGMVRYCVYFLLKVGNGEMTLKTFGDILEQRSELKQKEPALPNGLFLSKVEYPFLTLESPHHLIRTLRSGLDI